MARALEREYVRDGDGQFAETPGGGALDKLKLAGRIKLDATESFVASDVFKLRDGSILPMALTRTTNGLRLRMGVGVLQEDQKRWSGRNLGSTVSFDEPGIAQLRAAVDEMRAKGDEGGRRFRAIEDRGAELDQQRRDILKRQYGSLSRADGKRLDKVDRRLEQIGGEIASDEGWLRSAADFLAERDPGKRARWDEIEAEIATLDPNDMRIVVLRDEQASFLAATHIGRAKWRSIDRLKEEREDLELERQVLTTLATPLSAQDQADLGAVEAEIARNAVERQQMDEATLVEGAISSEWADLVYEVYTHETTYDYDNLVSYRIAARPKDAPADWSPGDDTEPTDLAPAELAKLGQALDELTSRSTESASTSRLSLITSPAVRLMLFARSLEGRETVIRNGKPVTISRGGKGRFGSLPDVPKVPTVKPEPKARPGSVTKALLSGETAALDGFNREQLRREAGKRGIALKRGTSADAIKDALWDHERSGVDDEADLPAVEKAELDLARMTVPQLKERAKVEGVKGYSKMRKAELVAALTRPNASDSSGELASQKSQPPDVSSVLEQIAPMEANPKSGDRERVAELLAPLTVPQLNEVAAAHGITYLHGNKDRRRSDLLHGLVGHKLDTRTIVGGGDWNKSMVPERSAAKPQAGLPTYRNATRNLPDDLVYDIERDVRAAHLAAVSQPGRNEYSFFSEWRAPLDAKYGRANVDAVIVDLGSGGSPDSGFYIIGETNQKTLTPGRRAGAVQMGNQDNHLLSLRASVDPATPKLVPARTVTTAPVAPPVRAPSPAAQQWSEVLRELRAATADDEQKVRALLDTLAATRPNLRGS